MEALNEIVQLFISHPESIFIIIISWFLIILILDKLLDVHITPWWGLFSLLLAIGVGVFYIIYYQQIMDLFGLNSHVFISQSLGFFPFILRNFFL